MEFRTEISLGRAPFGIGHSSKIFMAGSCFSENICAKMSSLKFGVCGNPYGVLFNPASIATMLSDLAAGRVYGSGDIRNEGGLWFSWKHHGSFSGTDPEQALSDINEAAARGAEALAVADYVILTFGTAWIYRLASTGEVVANCHKMPADMFVRERLTVEGIIDLYRPLFDGILKGKNVIITVSPVRHLKDGFAENSLSKAILRVAAEELTARYANAYYFPALEIMADDLRDYRFYADDMVHPSATAVAYIWKKFSGWALDERSWEILPKLEKLASAMGHRVLRPDDEAAKTFARKMLSLVGELEARLPDTDFSAEKFRFSSML